MQISAKARLISIIIAVVFMFGALAGTGAYLIVNHINKANALKGGSSIGDIIDTSNKTLVNYDTYRKLMDRLGDRKGGATTLENGGSAIVFTMAGRDWQVVYRDPANSDIITVWMTEPYTSSVFDGTSPYSDAYNGSLIQTTVNNYYTTQVATYTAMSSFIRTPSKMSSKYKTAQAQNGTYDGYASDQGALGGSENFWLPSHHEIHSLWGLDANDRGFDDTGVSNSCWLRSGYSTLNDLAMLVNSSGSASLSNVRNSNGVRPACHIALSALANAASYTITAQSNNTSYGTVSGGGRVQVNSSVTLTATPQTGYHFVRWESNGATVSTDASYTFTATASGTYTAIFEPNSYTITAKLSPAGAGSVTGGGSYNYNTQATLSATTNSGYEFLGWDTNGDGSVDNTANPYTFTVTDNATITAIFKQLITITICTNNAEYGQIFVNGSLSTSTTFTQDANTQINNIMAIAKNNCAFLYWYDESNGNVYYDNPLNYTVTQSTTLTAYFGSGVVDGVAVSVECPDTTEVVAAGEARIIGYTNYNGIDYVHFSAVAYTGYRFVGWRVDGEILADYTTESADIPYSIVENKQVFAVFLPLENTGNINDSTDNGQTDDF